MFKNKYLHQLQYVQGQIKKCKANITNLKPPTPYNFPIAKDVKDWFYALFWSCNPKLSTLTESYTLKYGSLDYLRTLGEYMVNVADYYQSEKKYEEELEQLQKEECILKEKLGID